LSIIHTDIKPENILFKGIPEYRQKIIDSFQNSGFQQKYDRLLAITNRDKSKVAKELESLAFEAIQDIGKMTLDVCREEEFVPDEEDDFISNEEEADSDGSDEEISDDDETEKDEVVNVRRQSVTDKMEHLGYKIIHNIDTEGKYDFDSILNKREFSSDKTEIIDDAWIMNCETALTDFGNSYFADKRSKNEIQDRRYRAPEIILDQNYSYSCDMWSVGCLVFELLTGYALFEPDELPVNLDINHLYLMEKMLGPMNTSMKKKITEKKILI